MIAPRTVSMTTRDGVRLDADLYQPEQEGRFPVLLMRQPYGRRIASTVCYAHPDWYAAQGYIVVIQDVRGRGTSAGDFRIFEADAEDGADAIAWAAALPGSTGDVGMYGFSYQGTNQLLAAGETPSALRALSPAMIGWDLRTDWAYEGGAFAWQAGLGWALQLAAEGAKHAGDNGAFLALRQAAQSPPMAVRPAVMETHRALSHYHDWIDNPDDCAYWRRISPSSRVEAIRDARIPTLLVGGWYDSHLPGTLAAWHALSGHGPAHIVVGPWAHFPWGRRIGALDFGPDAISDIDTLQVQWFDHWLKGEGAIIHAPVRLFDMGTRAWRDFETWPRAGMTLYLAGGGRAALDERDGVLRLSPPRTTTHETLVHDPWRPVPSLPPATDRTLIDQRPDVLTFTSPPFTEPTLLAGSIGASLTIDADAPDFDVSCTLSRIHSGQTVAFAEGYRRVTTPGPVQVGMRATCLTLQPGDRLRLSIAGAAHPAFPVNPGTGDDPTRAAAIDARIITLRVAHGSSLSIGI